MRNPGSLLLLAAFIAIPACGYQQPGCVAPALSDGQIKDIVDKERAAANTRLPAAFAKYRSVVRRQGCYYVYIEYSLPETPDDNHIFKLNQQGVIVDSTPGSPKCPDKVLTESELAEIVARERAKRRD